MHAVENFARGYSMESAEPSDDEGSVQSADGVKSRA